MPNHPHLILSLKEAEELNNIKDKNTLIIATGQADLQFLCCSIFSILIRSNLNKPLNHICVMINGPDARTGDPTLQDKKQEFLEDLRNEKWCDLDMPLTISRIWSRVGHTQAMEMAIPWINTEFFSIMHDDVILDNFNLHNYLSAIFEDEKVAMVSSPPILKGYVKSSKYNDKRKLEIPHVNSEFITCRKSLFIESGCRWPGYHVECKFDFDNWKYKKEFLNYYQDLPLNVSGNYEVLNWDIGAYVYYQFEQKGYKTKSLPRNLFQHFSAASWDQNVEIRMKQWLPHVKKLEMELLKFPKFKMLYDKWIK